MRVAVIDTGYVGLVAGAGFSDFGNEVTCVDIDAQRITLLRGGEIPIYEPRLEELVRRNTEEGRLRFTTEIGEAVARAEVVLIAVGTPQGNYGLGADLEQVWAAGCAIPYPANTFDVVLCSHVLEHAPDDRKAMSELFRVMKPGAWGLIEAPIQRTRTETFEDWSVTSETDRERVFGQRDHVRIYGRDYYDRLRSAGFSVEEHHYAQELPASIIEKHLLKPTGVISICTKAPGAS